MAAAEAAKDELESDDGAEAAPKADGKKRKRPSAAAAKDGDKKKKPAKAPKSKGVSSQKCPSLDRGRQDADALALPIHPGCRRCARFQEGKDDR